MSTPGGGREDLGQTARGWALIDPLDGAPSVVVLAEAAGDDDLLAAIEALRAPADPGALRFAGAWHEGVAAGVGEQVLVLRIADTRGRRRRSYVLRDPSARLLEVVRFDHVVRLLPLARGEELPAGEELAGRLGDALEVRAFGGPPAGPGS